VDSNYLIGTINLERLMQSAWVNDPLVSIILTRNG
jgi:hypothetical protein